MNHLVIEPGAERAVAAALGDAMGAVIVSGRDEARTAVERLAAGDAGAWLLVLDAADTAVTTGATLAPEGARPLASCVRASLPGLQATLARTLAGVVLADGDWHVAMDLAVANPDLTVMTGSGDRFGGGRPWRFGAEQSAGVTRAAFDEAIEAAERAVEARDAARSAVDAARVAVGDAREVEQRTAESARKARSELDRAAGRGRPHRERARWSATTSSRSPAAPAWAWSRRSRSSTSGCASSRGACPSSSPPRPTRSAGPTRVPRSSRTWSGAPRRSRDCAVSTRHGSRRSTNGARCSPGARPRWRSVSPGIPRPRPRPSATAPS